MEGVLFHFFFRPRPRSPDTQCSLLYQFWPMLVLSIILVAITIILDSLMVDADYSSIEFAFSAAQFREAMTPFLQDPYSSQIFCVSGGLHFFAGPVYFVTTTIIVCWACNHDRSSRLWGDTIAWMQFMGWLLDIAAQSLIIAAFVGFPPAGFRYAEIVFFIWGIQLIFKDLMLAIAVIYGIIIRILAWTIWKDDEPRNSEIQLRAMQTVGGGND